MKYYAAYGSNMNLQQMASRCPKAKVVVTGTIRNYQLVFNYHASIVKKSGCNTPIAIWALTKECEQALDRYEGFPTYYRKENVHVITADGKRLIAMAYVMNKDVINIPSWQYFRCILEGYKALNIGPTPLYNAYERTLKNCKKDFTKPALNSFTSL